MRASHVSTLLDLTVPHLTVILPYYQEKTGILHRALTSLLAQNLPPATKIHTIVVDDGSPAPVAQELSGLNFSEPFSLQVIHQPNGGCAAARNSGMSAIPVETEFVAFLDSDDIWGSQHLADALKGLNNGCDVYFTDHSRIGHHASHFSDIGFPHNNLSQILKPFDQDLWELDAKPFFRYFLRTFTAHLSGFVYRRSCCPEVRFVDSLRLAGEDYVFMLQVAQAARRVCFSRHIAVTCGDGVNVYNGHYAWDTEGNLRRVLGDLFCAYKQLSALDLKGDDRVYIKRRIRLHRRRFAFFTMRWFIKKRAAFSPQLKQMVGQDRAA